MISVRSSQSNFIYASQLDALLPHAAAVAVAAAALVSVHLLFHFVRTSRVRFREEAPALFSRAVTYIQSNLYLTKRVNIKKKYCQ